MLCYQGSAQTIEMKTIDSGPSYRIKTTKLNDEFKIVYMRRDTSDKQKIKLEMEKMGISLGLVAQNFGPLGPDKAMKKAAEFYSMVDRYTYYIKDSVQVKIASEPEYATLFNVFMNESEDSLNKSSRSENVMILDGTRFSWIVKQDTIIKRIYAHSPEAKDYPLLTQYIKAVFAIYRKRINGNMFGDFYYYKYN